ncbi:hypothetical protein Hdeb2414_s0005g00184311 [Helianthus debilis subsp. tardiflorus]
MKFPTKLSGNRYDNSNSLKASYWSKGFLEINSRYLRITFCNQSGFVTSYVSCTIIFQLVHPLETHYILSMRKINQFPCIILFKCH